MHCEHERNKRNTIHDDIKTRWTYLYPQYVTGDDSDLQLLCFSLHIPMIDCCVKEFNIWLADISLSLAEEMWLDEEVSKNRLNRVTQTGLVQYYMASIMKKEDRSATCSYAGVCPLAQT